MTKAQVYLYRLIVQGSLLCVAGVAPLHGQSTTPEPRHASAPPPGSAVAPAPATGERGEYTGAAGCSGCHKHDQIWKNFYKDPHFRSVASGKEPPEKTGCEGCHGPGKAHVDARGDVDTVVHAFSVMKPREVIALCLNCHAKEFSRANIRRSEHTEHDVACTACHSIRVWLLWNDGPGGVKTALVLFDVELPVGIEVS